MKNKMKRTLALLLAFVLICACLTGCGSRISKKAALSIALNDAGFTQAQVYDIDVDFENEYGNKYYEVNFNNGGLEYKYVINSQTGEIMSSYSEYD